MTVDTRGLLDDLSIRLTRRRRRVFDRPRRAAVLVPVIDDAGGPLRLILTRRADDLPTHKGEVAFPGGGVDPDDRGVVDAALREAYEEIGLDRTHVEVLGMLDDFPTARDDTAVTPVVGRVRGFPPLRAAPGEVARVFDIPVDALGDPYGWVTRPWQRDNRHYPVFYFEWVGETLWGLSAYIALHLLDVSVAGAPFPIPEWRER